MSLMHEERTFLPNQSLPALTTKVFIFLSFIQQPQKIIMHCIIGPNFGRLTHLSSTFVVPAISLELIVFSVFTCLLHSMQYRKASSSLPKNSIIWCILLVRIHYKAVCRILIIYLLII